ncbi:MAG TPA: protein kinase [Chthoniobacterales bacterium]|nr:protein kinase [Chthoniobacterales bacterium]
MNDDRVTAPGHQILVCPSCGTKIPASLTPERCPVCQLRAALTVNLASDSAPPNPEGLANGVQELTDGAIESFDHYEILKGSNGAPAELGCGAMGVTYRAIDKNLRCPVALKVINPRYLKDESARVRFVREARAAARLRHPNVASVFHLGTKNGDYFYAMELVEGTTLHQLIQQKGPMPVPLALEITDQVAAALEAAHKEQIIHRDIKPGNIMLRFNDNGAVNVKVIDFGLAKAAAASSLNSEPGLSVPGSFTGTALFASPEQCAGREVDIRSDIYSLGVTLWECLTAKVPFTGTTFEVISQHLHSPLPLEQLKQIPLPVVGLLRKMLAKSPDERQQTPSELRAELRALKQTLEISPSRPAETVPPSAGKSRFGVRMWLFLGGLTLVIASVIGYFLWSVNSRLGSTSSKSVAVLPFDNLSDNKSSDYFADGLTSEVIYQLSKVGDLQVTARSSVLRYKDVPDAQRKPLKEIGAELDVGAVLEGSVERSDNKVRIVAILYDARTERRLWGATYDRQLQDVLTIQGDLAEQIAVALHARLSTDERNSLRNEPALNPSAYDLYFQAKALSDLHLKDANDKAVDLFKQAIQQDSKFGLAYVGLADAYIDRVKRFNGEGSWLDSAINLCQQAIALDPNQLRAYTQLANAFNLKGWFDRMGAPISKALELAPNDWDANRMAAAVSTELRRQKEMYTSIRKCFETNPFDSWAPYQLALICWTVHESDLAEKWMRRAIDLEPNATKRQLMENERLVYRGDYAGALPGLQRLPPDVKTQYSAASDLVLFCTMKIGDWRSVIQIIQAKADKDSPTNLMRLTLALRGTMRSGEARQSAERTVTSAQSKLSTAKAPRWMRFDLAVGNRILERNEAAFQYLRELMIGTGFPDPVLGLADPGLDVFLSDSEFQTLLDDVSQKNAEIRSQISQIEQSFIVAK